MMPVVGGEAGLSCAHCQAPLPREAWNTSEPVPCPVCRVPTTALVFPALFAIPAPVAAVAAAEGEACCFYHPEKRAVIPCDQCGRLLCALCHVDFLGQNWCPACIETRRAKGKLVNLETSRMMYDNIALSAALLPLLAWPITIFTAPWALYMVIRNWRSPGSLVRRWRIRLYLAGFFAIVESGFWIWLIAFALYRIL